MKFLNFGVSEIHFIKDPWLTIVLFGAKLDFQII